MPENDFSCFEIKISAPFVFDKGGGQIQLLREIRAQFCVKI